MASVLALSLTLTLAPPLATGDEAAPAAAPATASLKAAASRLVHGGPAREVRRTQDPAPATATESPRGFFSTGRGKFVLILTAAAMGFAVYSTQANDVKRAPQRQ